MAVSIVANRPDTAVVSLLSLADGDSRLRLSPGSLLIVEHIVAKLQCLSVVKDINEPDGTDIQYPYPP